MKILITGATGQVGTQLMNILASGKSELGNIPREIENVEVIGTGSKELDISDNKKVIEFIREVKPDVVINAAAYTNVDGCEINEELAYKVNALGPKNLAIACEKIGAKLVHISTDYVFNGVGNKPFREYDHLDPQSIYGASKKMGEDFVREFSSKYFIVRPSWVYGYQGKNFVYTILKLAKENGVITVVNDQRGNPTNVEDIVHHILKLIVTEEYGIYNCSGQGECTWYDFACKIVEFANISCTVKPCTSDEYQSKVKRPAYSSLDNMMLKYTVGDEMRNWEEALRVFINNIKI
ncbi:dTDP-4-dehydrorhamnose reductase [Inconstantimicrobium mannanitabidum]|uniref:NAD(P)-dependent oxidoreductase n=1 Tax=Inconstantimicrobium mannanitabidum TaxID=1604901 RepID=A0ACB5R8K1_9CLOT|nr:dTDP-4-dehydrorhamnose reductase [Clostridium sp. TW13]GKX65359.1 NAD(P)-dependent oxidoreductase [Clostridium sp. TW13]